MKKIFCISLAAITVIIFLAGCQPTPEKETVIQKDMEQMIETAQETPDTTAGTLAERLGAPDTYQSTFSNAKGNVTVCVDAPVMLPNTDRVPTAKVKERMFSQETADRLMELLFKGYTLYELEGYLQETKGDIMEKLIKLYAMREGTIPVEVDGDLEETIVFYEKEYEEAPEERTLVPAQTTFHQMVQEGMEPYDYIEGITDLNGSPAYFLIQNDMAENRIYAEFCKDFNNRYAYNSVNELRGKFGIDETKLITNITVEQARAQADDFIEGLELSPYMGFACTEIAIHLNSGEELAKGDDIDYSTTKTAYLVRYVRNVEGVPITYTGDTGGQIADEDSYAQPWDYEAINFVIDETGIVEFYWTSPYTEPEIVTGDTNLLSFSEIKQVFENMVLVNYAYYEGGTLQLNVNSVQLGLMRVTETNHRDSGVLIPIWNFMGSITMIREGEEPTLREQTSNSLLTINAIDGSVIDRGLGY